MKKTIMETMGWKNEAYVKAILATAFVDYRKQLEIIETAIGKIQKDIQPILKTVKSDELSRMLNKTVSPEDCATITADLDYWKRITLETRESLALENLDLLGRSIHLLRFKFYTFGFHHWRNKKLLTEEKARYERLILSGDDKDVRKARKTPYAKFEDFMCGIVDGKPNKDTL